MKKTAKSRKTKNVTKSVRLTPDDVDLIYAGANKSGMSFSDFIIYCVKKELTGSTTVSPDSLEEIQRQISQAKKAIIASEVMINNVKHGADYALETTVTEVIEKEMEEAFKVRLNRWIKDAVKAIKTSPDPRGASKVFIEEGIREYGITDYAISILENTANPNIPIRE